jgi:penicillin-insensitive murein endopeptidase
LPLYSAAVESVCHGRPGAGRLENAVQLPARGRNFIAYSEEGVQRGRTYLHSRIVATVLDTYASLERSAPGKLFVYGETGLATGGPMPPHHTHQNGLSIDFMVPVVDENGHSVRLPGDAAHKYGYGVEFDQRGKAGKLTLDAVAMGEHLFALVAAAKQHNVNISLVIFDPALQPLLLSTRHGPALRRALPFMRGKPWIRHDEHYHIDFSITCSK